MLLDDLIERCNEVLEEHKKKMSGEHHWASLQAEFER
jgi:hypothetical protein